jgi:hypothetical protein
VVPYEQIYAIASGDPVVFVDMANDGTVVGAVHRHFGKRLTHSCVVGATHWESAPRERDLPGPRPAFFFAPARIEKRTRDWGGRALQERMAEAWRDFVTDSQGWLEIVEGRGRADVERVSRHPRARPAGHALAHYAPTRRSRGRCRGRPRRRTQ